MLRQAATMVRLKVLHGSAMQTLCGCGDLEDFGIPKIYRDVRVAQIYKDMSDIPRNRSSCEAGHLRRVGQVVGRSASADDIGVN
jgi:hypothetical protein